MSVSEVLKEVQELRKEIAEIRSILSDSKSIVTDCKGKGKAKGAVKEKKEKKEKVKRPLSAYMHFANSNRDIIKKENPSASFGELGKLLGKKWKELTEVDKKQYVDKVKAV